jgi:hypothetical protein
MAARAEATGDGVNPPWQGAAIARRGARHSCRGATAGATAGGERHDWLGFFRGRKGLMASAAPCLHVLAFWADSCWVVACQSPVWLDFLRH